jgi:hypothetical membrane protein
MKPSREQATSRSLSVAGAAAMLAAALWILFVIVAETRYPGYSVHANYLSDLGATCHRGLEAPTPCIIVAAPSLIWNTTLSLFGILTLVSAVFFFRATRRIAFSICLAVFGAGALIAGVVPETLLWVHEIGTLISFIGGSVAALLGFRILRAPLNVFSLVLGVVSLVATFVVTFQGPFIQWNDAFGLGPGGIERMVVYPLMIWEIAFGAAASVAVSSEIATAPQTNASAIAEPVSAHMPRA